MARFLQAYCLCLVFFVLTAGSMMKTTLAKACMEDLGTCDPGNDDCGRRCYTKHGEGSQGTCDTAISPPVCSCTYFCPPSA
ncbi:hypothetical protein BT93_L1837 [Corymbia citriodora subsp. variegata]|uniref:Defensin-like protein n=1 Tax=Corymbia citriodora subsp. variegata TaxID=360336 RepID=A0A8T0CQR0_CORYI|nr:hypothetical protein BT93_L1837 [Corymbia citriodora subsp. variegata]